jgi:hypothetical protein
VSAETFKAARIRMVDALAALGWATKRDLKTPHATSPDGFMVRFTAQAVHDSAGRSMWIDIRGMSAEEFAMTIERRNAGGAK